MKRQQRFLKALYEKTFQLKTILAAPYIPFLFTKDIKTNIEIFDLKYFVNCISKIYGSSPMMFVLPGYEDENNDWVPDFETIRILKDEMFNIE